MNFGFNTDIQVGDLVLHVQTEDRGKRNPVLDTTVYAAGRVLHQRKRNYAENLDDPNFNDEVLRKWLEDQHRTVIEELRSGALVVSIPAPKPPPALPAPPAAAPAPAPAPAPGHAPTQKDIRVQLTNPASWLKAGSATLVIEVHSRLLGQPVENVQIEVTFEGAQHPVMFMATTDQQGRAELTFPMPHLGSGGADLVIRASSPGGVDEIRYSLRAKNRPPTK
jgi:hypothetical protein